MPAAGQLRPPRGLTAGEIEGMHEVEAVPGDELRQVQCPAGVDAGVDGGAHVGEEWNGGEAEIVEDLGETFEQLPGRRVPRLQHVVEGFVLSDQDQVDEAVQREADLGEIEAAVAVDVADGGVLEKVEDAAVVLGRVGQRPVRARVHVPQTRAVRPEEHEIGGREARRNLEAG